MPYLDEQYLFCSMCGKEMLIPVCCNKNMEYDGENFFCPTCGKIRKINTCCNSIPKISRRVRNIKKTLFKSPDVIRV